MKLHRWRTPSWNLPVSVSDSPPKLVASSCWYGAVEVVVWSYGVELVGVHYVASVSMPELKE